MGESIAEVAAIAAKLTKAQREALVERARGSRRTTRRTTAQALYRRNLLAVDSGVAAVTSLGLSVSHLISQGADHDR